MRNKSNIFWFLIISLLLHIIFFVQYEKYDGLIFYNNKNDTSLSFSRKTMAQAYPPVSFNVKIHMASNIQQAIQREKNLNKENLVHTSTNHTKEILSQPNQQPDQNKVIQNNYIKKIVMNIEKNKYYPALARSRNMQDIIDVQFELLRNGKVLNLKIKGNYKSLRHAARTAIFNAMPFPEPSQNIRFPIDVKYAMAFKLK